MTIENEDDIIDATAEKAKAIGKELGVEEDSKSEDDVPDYDIKEEDDASLAKGASKESPEDRKERDKLSNREKRQLRKKRTNEKFNEKDTIIAQQAQQMAAMAARLDEVDGRLSRITKADIEKAWGDNSAVYEKAKKDSLDAFAEGDGAKHLAALETMKQADDRAKEIRGIYAQVDKAPKQPPAKESKPDPRIVNKANAWAQKNAWYNGEGGDTDSEVAKAISGALVKEGFDPKGDDFWEELDDRLVKYIPDKVQAEDEDDEDDTPAPKQQKRSAPPVGRGSNRGDLVGKKTITLPTSYINTLKANGIWDDVPRRNKIIAERERILREQRA